LNIILSLRLDVLSSKNTFGITEDKRLCLARTALTSDQILTIHSKAAPGRSDQREHNRKTRE